MRFSHVCCKFSFSLIVLFVMSSNAFAQRGGAPKTSYQRSRVGGYVMTHPVLRDSFFRSYESFVKSNESVTAYKDVVALREKLSELTAHEAKLQEAVRRGEPKEKELKRLQDQIDGTLAPHVSRANEYIFSRGDMVDFLTQPIRPKEGNRSAKFDAEVSMIRDLVHGPTEGGGIATEMAGHSFTMSRSANVPEKAFVDFIEFQRSRIGEGKTFSGASVDALKVMEKTAADLATFRSGGQFQVAKEGPGGRTEFVRIPGETDKGVHDKAAKIFERLLETRDAESMELLQEALRTESPVLRREAINALDRLTEIFQGRFQTELARRKGELDAAVSKGNAAKEREILDAVSKKAAEDTLRDLEQNLRRQWEGEGKSRRQLSQAEETRLQAILGLFKCRCFKAARDAAGASCRVNPGGGSGGSGGTHNWRPR